MNWWFWSAWVQTHGGKIVPLYSFAARTRAIAAKKSEATTALPSGGALHRAEVCVDEATGNKWLADLDERTRSAIQLDSVLDGAPSIEVIGSRAVIAPAFGHSNVNLEHFVGKVGFDALLGDAPDAAIALRFLEKELGLEFKKEYAGHLGGFDLFNLSEPFDGIPHFRCSPERVDGARNIRIMRKERFPMLVRVRLESLKNIVRQQLVTWDVEEPVLDIPMQEDVDTSSVEVYGTENGDLLFSEECTYVISIHLNSGIAGNTLHHNDTLSQRAVSQGSRVQLRASKTTSVTREQTVLGGSSIRNQVLSSDRAVKQISAYSGDRWFDRGVSEEVDVIEHINALLNASDVKRMILVDPFFGEEALKRFILRIERADLPITVVMSWGATDPDSAAPVEANENQIRLNNLVEAIRPAIKCDLKILNLVTGGGAQAFHDRYLAIYKGDGECSIWLLSNSINSMAVNWPFCMSQLTGNARWHAQQYLQGLELGNDITTKKKIEKTFDWTLAQSAKNHS